MFRRSAPLDESDWKRIREIRAEAGEDYKPFRNKANNYLQDRDAMKTWSFSGMGRIFNTQDVAIVEGSGAILDRTQEYLGSSDKAIITCRRIALKAIRDVQSGKEPPNVVRSPQANRFDHITCISDLTETADWKTYMEKRLS
jgi:hypothetical protein